MEMKRHAIWHNFQRIIPQIKKSIIFLLLKYQKNINLHIIRFSLSLSHFGSILNPRQSSTPSSIIFINVTFLLQQQKLFFCSRRWKRRNQGDRIYLILAFDSQFGRAEKSAKAMWKSNFRDCKLFHLREAREKYSLTPELKKILNSNNYFLRFRPVSRRFNNAC